MGLKKEETLQEPGAFVFYEVFDYCVNIFLRLPRITLNRKPASSMTGKKDMVCYIIPNQ